MRVVTYSWKSWAVSRQILGNRNAPPVEMSQARIQSSIGNDIFGVIRLTFRASKTVGECTIRRGASVDSIGKNILELSSFSDFL